LEVVQPPAVYSAGPGSANRPRGDNGVSRARIQHATEGTMKAQQTRPLIGINADFVPATKINPAYARLNAGYFDSIATAGGLPVVIPPLGKESELNAFLDQLDGVILSSGLDMDPRRQGQPTHPAVQPMPERREESDRILVKLIVQRKIPVLGINLGTLQLNAACGGSVFLHLP